MKKITVASVWLLLVASLASAQGPILTPKPSPVPRVNGPAVFGVRPGSPFLYAIPATGERPMAYDVAGLPPGLSVDAATGRISGFLRAKGEYPVVLKVRNRLGTAEKKFRIVCGDTIALTPPMGWSSWYMAYTNISDAMIRAQAKAMVDSGLADHGYVYINLDDGWNIKLESADPVIGGPSARRVGRPPHQQELPRHEGPLRLRP